LPIVRFVLGFQEIIIQTPGVRTSSFHIKEYAMPVIHRYDEKKKILFVTLKGTFTLAEFKSSMSRISGSPMYPADTNALWDLRSLDFASINVDFWQQLFAIRQQHPEHQAARLAHVIGDDFAFGMMRMYQILASTSKNNLVKQLMVTKSYEQAEEWLQS